MENISDTVKKKAGGISKYLNDEPQDKIYILWKKGGSTSEELLNVESSTTKSASESGTIMEKFEEDGFYDDDFFSENGIYVFKFSNKILADYQFIKLDKPINMEPIEVRAVVLKKIYDLTPSALISPEKLEALLQEENIFNDENDNLDKSGIYYNGTEIIFSSDFIKSKEHVQDDLKLLDDKTMDRIMREKFLPWLKQNQPDMDDDKILEGLKLFGVSYSARDSYNKFTFSFESGDDYTKNLLQAADIEIIIRDGKIVEDEISCYDI